MEDAPVWAIGVAFVVINGATLALVFYLVKRLDGAALARARADADARKAAEKRAEQAELEAKRVMGWDDDRFKTRFTRPSPPDATVPIPLVLDTKTRPLPLPKHFQPHWPHGGAPLTIDGAKPEPPPLPALPPPPAPALPPEDQDPGGLNETQQRPRQG